MMIGSRAALRLVRFAGRTLAIPGWFPLVVERFHPRLAGGRCNVVLEVWGSRMHLDLTEYIQRRIYYDSFESRERRFVQQLLRSGDVVLDVGANVGLFTLLAASRVGPSGEVHAFEPVPSNYAALSENVRLNGFQQVALNRVAVGAARGKTSLGLDDVSARVRNHGGFTEGGPHERIEAEVIDLDAYLRGRVLSAPLRLVKIDVEGAEATVLQGLWETLSRRPPDVIMVEVSVEVLLEHDQSAQDVIGPLLECGYSLYRITPRSRLKPLRAIPSPRGRPLRASSSAAIAQALRAVHEWRSLVNVVAVRNGIPASSLLARRRTRHESPAKVKGA
jgi:FkbM family methyltransferase